ncbi:LOW QUALITY PROTEIN: uncharacterized protein LOC144764030 [Lissotriton helveticus]
MEVVVIETVCTPDMELMIFTINPTAREVRKGALLYRPPGSCGPFSIKLMELLAPHIQTNSDFLLVGDFNIHSEITTCIDAQTVLADLATLGLTKKNQGPTHSAGHTLDLVLYNSTAINCLTPNQVVWTDHSVIVFYTRDNNKAKTIYKKLANVRRPWYRLTPDKFRANYSEPKWEAFGDDATLALKAFSDAVLTTINHVAPLRTYKPRPAPKQEVWFTGDLRQQKKIMRGLEKKWRVTHKADDKENFRRSSKKYHKAIRAARKQHIAAQLSDAGSNNLLRKDNCSKLKQEKEKNTLQNPERGNNSTKKMRSKCKRDTGGQSTLFEKGLRKVVLSSLHQGIAKMSYSNNSDSEQNVKLVKFNQNTLQKRSDYTCPTCKKQFSVKGYFTRHLQIHSCVHQHQCTECNKCFSRKKNLVIHLRTHSGERPFECTECEKGFNEKKSLIIHLRRHSGERPFQCTKCTKGFTTRGGLVVHLRTHSGERPYQCIECQKSFIQKGHLKKHQKIHSGERTFLCPKCGISFDQETQLISHQKVHYSKEEESQSTRHEEEYSILSGFHEHKASLNAERQNQCNECRKNLRELNDHIRFHRTYKGENVCKCTECEKIFAENTHHIMQQRMHSGERPGKRHTVVARLLEVSVPNEYFVFHHEEYNKV